MKRAALAALVLLAGVASADDDEGAAFRDAAAHADIDALEKLGAARPLTRWSDDAWAEAARIAERGNDFARARNDLEQAIAVGSDPVLVHRAENDLARITRTAGASGEWSAVIAEEQRLLPAIYQGGDPRPSLAALEKLAQEHPRYPGSTSLMISIAAGWEREGDTDRALRWLRDAQRAAVTPTDKLRAASEVVRTLTRSARIAAAESELAALRSFAPPELVTNLRAGLDRAELRRDVRWGMWGVLAVLAAVAILALRRAAGTWRAAGRRLVKPPGEAVFIVPIAVVLIAIASTGNPLVAAAVRSIIIAGVAASWISGAILAGSRVTLPRAAIHALLAVLAVGAATYVAIDRGHLVDFLVETWRHGHELG